MEFFKKHKVILIVCAVVIMAIIGNFLPDEDANTKTQEVSSEEETSNQDSGERQEKVKELNTFVKENNLKAKFDLDPNDSTTLCFYRESTMSADNIDFKNAVLGYGTTIEELKEIGFSKVRVYSSKDSYKKYNLILL